MQERKKKNFIGEQVMGEFLFYLFLSIEREKGGDCRQSGRVVAFAVFFFESTAFSAAASAAASSSMKGNIEVTLSAITFHYTLNSFLPSSKS